MKRLTTDTPRTAAAAALNRFYVKDHEAWVRDLGSCCDFSALDAIREAAVNLEDLHRICEGTDLMGGPYPAEDDDLADRLYDDLQEGVATLDGVLALLHEAVWVAAELRERLLLYEDGLPDPSEEPEAKRTGLLDFWAEAGGHE